MSKKKDKYIPTEFFIKALDETDPEDAGTSIDNLNFTPGGPDSVDFDEFMKALKKSIDE